MSDKTRRDLLISAGALAATSLACGGGPKNPSEKAKRAHKEPAMPPPPRGGEATTARGGTLFMPAEELDGTPPTEWTERPEWMRRAPGIYNPTPVTAGASTLLFGHRELYAMPTRISHFRELPKFLDEAKKLGTNILYIVDTYQGPDDWPPAKWRLWKETYRIRDDLGGAKALKRAIAEVHERGGKVIMYVSGWALHVDSELGKKHGRDWAIIQNGEPTDRPYKDNYMPCTYVEAWQDHIVSICEGYARDLGADGVHVDSLGNQRNWKCESTEHGHEPRDPTAFNLGCQQLLERVRAAMRRHVPEAVVICEGAKLSRLFKGGLDGAQDWGINKLMTRWSWNQAGRTSIYCANWSLDDMHQIAALGHKWMLSPYWLSAPTEPTVTEWIAAHVPEPELGGTEKSRRNELERIYRGLHIYRNAALLAGRTVPSLDDLTHRRHDGEEASLTEEGARAHLAALRDRARALDEALGGPVDPSSITTHLRRVMQAREALSPHIDDGASVSLLATVPGKAAAYMWSQSSKTLALVNVSDTAQHIDLSTVGTIRGTLRDAISGEIVEISSATPVPAHHLMFVRPA